MTKRFINFTTGAFQGTSHSNHVIHSFKQVNPESRREQSILEGPFAFFVSFVLFLYKVHSESQEACNNSKQRANNKCHHVQIESHWLNEEQFSAWERSRSPNYTERLRNKSENQLLSERHDVLRQHEEEATQLFYMQMKCWHHKSQSLEVKITNFMRLYAGQRRALNNALLTFTPKPLS